MTVFIVGFIPEVSAAPASKLLGTRDSEVRELLARKHWLRAANAVDARSAEARLVKGYALLRSGRAERALQTLDGLTGLSAALSDFLKLQRAQAHLELDMAESALEALDAVEAPDRLGKMWSRLRARALRQAGRRHDILPDKMDRYSFAAVS